MNKEQAIKKEKEYAERRFNQLLAEAEKINSIESPEDQATKLMYLDSKWRNFCEHLIYIFPNGKDEFIKVAKERAFKTIKIEQ